MIERNEGLPVDLGRAARLLRDAPEPSDLWRQKVLDSVRALPMPARADKRRRSSRRWSVRPLTAIAAGLVCALAGGSAVAAVLHRPAAQSVVSQSRVRFSFDAPHATRVSIVGDFNGWNPTALPLHRAPDGRTWVVEVPLAPGRYAYSFVVDGALAPDPSAPRGTDDDFGAPNSILLVRGS